MKKETKMMNSFGYRIAISIVFALLVCTGCSAYSSSAASSSPSVETDSVMINAIGDSVYSIITGAKKVKAEAVKLGNDSTSNVGEITVDSKDISLLRFIISDPQNFLSDAIVYGKFRPCFTLTFISKKKETCIVNFDFGLRKWNVCDSKGRTLKKFDLSSNNMLRLANILFPGNKYFVTLINTEQK